MKRARHQDEVIYAYDRNDCPIWRVEIIAPERRCDNCAHSGGTGDGYVCANPRCYDRWPLEHWQLQYVPAYGCCIRWEEQT